MGVPKEQATRNRQAILDTASRIFRERGVDGVGVADLMKEAGFTHGGFYNHFESKEDLAAEACASAFACGTANLEQAVLANSGNRLSALRSFMESYLSEEQCGAPGGGCPTATLAVDAARHGKKMQAAYAGGIETFLRVIAEHFSAEIGGQGCELKSRESAIIVLANLIGTMVLARGVGSADPELTREVLAAGRSHLAWIAPDIVPEPDLSVSD